MNRDFAEMLSALSEAGADFLTNKRATGRPRDLADVAALEGDDG